MNNHNNFVAHAPYFSIFTSIKSRYLYIFLIRLKLNFYNSIKNKFKRLPLISLIPTDILKLAEKRASPDGDTLGGSVVCYDAEQDGDE